MSEFEVCGWVLCAEDLRKMQMVLAGPHLQASAFSMEQGMDGSPNL